MATKPAITLKSLKATHGNRAERVYQKIAVIGGHGVVPSFPPLDPNGYDEQTAKAVDEVLKAKKPTN